MTMVTTETPDFETKEAKKIRRGTNKPVDAMTRSDWRNFKSKLKELQEKEQHIFTTQLTLQHAHENLNRLIDDISREFFHLVPESELEDATEATEDQS